MFYSKSTGGFYDTAIHGENMPADAVNITKEEHAALMAGQSSGKIITADANGRPFLMDAPSPVVSVPVRVTMRQARLALHAAGLLQSVEDAINILPEPSKTTSRIEWDYASEVHRDSAFVALLGSGINLDDEALDDLFTMASTL